MNTVLRKVVEHFGQYLKKCKKNISLTKHLSENAKHLGSFGGNKVKTHFCQCPIIPTPYFVDIIDFDDIVE